MFLTIPYFKCTLLIRMVKANKQNSRFVQLLFIQGASVLFAGRPWSHYTQIHLQAGHYDHSLIFQPLNSSTGAVGVKGLAQGHLSGCNEEGASAAFLLSPARFILQTSWLQALFFKASLCHHCSKVGFLASLLKNI